MARFIKKHKQEIGISPDELLFRGKKKISEALLRVINYNASQLEEYTLKNVDELQKYINEKFVTWFNLDGLHDIMIMEDISKKLNLDTLLIAEVMNTTARPRVFEHENAVFISIKMLHQDTEPGLLTSENLSLILTNSVLASFQETKKNVFEPIRERIRKHKQIIRDSGTDYLTFIILDIVVDNYILILSELGEKIEDLDDHLLNNPQKSLIDQINYYKRELNFLRKNISPAKEMILNLLKLDTEFIHNDTKIHFKELLVNINQAHEISETYREILSDQLNIYHTTISNKLNEIMKFLTIFSVIFIPLTLIAGIYGTNFDFLPELHYKYSYFIMLGLMAVIGMGMLIYFKKKKWF